jgi:hypothetical protein
MHVHTKWLRIDSNSKDFKLGRKSGEHSASVGNIRTIETQENIYLIRDGYS